MIIYQYFVYIAQKGNYVYKKWMIYMK